MKTFFDFISSIRLAVVVILGLGVLSAVGTIVEARYDTEMAQKLVYHSKYMWAVMGLLSVNLIAVMVDRWPWKKHHFGFVLAHIGILLMLLGSVFTRFYGVDGSMSFEIGQKNRYVTISDQEVAVYASFMDTSPRQMFKRNVDFLLNPIAEGQPIEIPLGGKEVKLKDYYHYGIRKEEITPSTAKGDGPGVRFQLQNDRANFSEWLLRPMAKSQESVNMGPARVILSDGNHKYHSGNELVLMPTDNPKVLKYEIYTASKGGLTKKGTLQAGGSVETGWMGLTFRLLRVLPKAKRHVTYTEREFPNKVTHSALLLEHDGQEYWIAKNSVLKLFDEDKMFMLVYGNKRIDVGFDMKLEKFTIGTYQGTNKASAYESLVSVPDLGRQVISMNEPLKHNGFTFYQASFERDKSGKPVASILSVNYDPGRWVKYLGSLVLVLGCIILFYFKRGFRIRKRT